MLLRPGRLADLDAIVAHNIEMARETEGLALDPQLVREGVRRVLAGEVPGAAYLVAEAEGRVVGQLMRTTEWSDWRAAEVWWIQSVRVAPEWRGRGVFRALYERLVEEARGAGAAGVRLYVDERNRPAQRVYERLGMDGGHYRVFEHMFR